MGLDQCTGDKIRLIPLGKRAGCRSLAAAHYDPPAPASLHREYYRDADRDTRTHITERQASLQTQLGDDILYMMTDTLAPRRGAVSKGDGVASPLTQARWSCSP